MQHHCLIKRWMHGHLLCRDSVPSPQKLGGGLARQNPAKQQGGDFIKQIFFFFTLTYRDLSGSAQSSVTWDKRQLSCPECVFEMLCGQQ